ncbi:MAG: PqqD family protein [Armatimonadetes bacterium]|nr:PqqD family protein [Armatimonadota bacterium]
MGAFYSIVSQYLPFVRRKPVLDREKALKACPVRHPQVRFERNDDGEINLYLPRRKDRLSRALMFVLRAPPEKEIVLDEVGSDVWDLCDGVNSVEAIVTAVSKKYKITRRECETSIGAYLKTLGDRNLVGLRVSRRSLEEGKRGEPADKRPKTRKKQ